MQQADRIWLAYRQQEGDSSRHIPQSPEYNTEKTKVSLTFNNFSSISSGDAEPSDSTITVLASTSVWMSVTPEKKKKHKRKNSVVELQVQTTKALRRPHGFALSAASQSAISKFETNSIFVNQIATVLISGTFQMRLIGSDLYERSPPFPRVLSRYHLFPLGIQRPQEWRLLLIGAHVRVPVTLESCLKI